MSLRLEMLQVARLAPNVLGEAAALVARFFLSKRLDSGGFCDRSGNADLYYTVFGLEGMLALQSPIGHEPTRDYLSSFGSGDGLDFVHLCCLARSWASMAGAGAGWGVPQEIACAIGGRLGLFRSGDGGFHPSPRAENGTAYAAFLAVGAFQDLGLSVPESERLLQSLEKLRVRAGGWANEPGIPSGATNSSAAVIAVRRQLEGYNRSDPAAAHWLTLQAHPMGGFKAAPVAPIPDLLSTATALHALAALEVELKPFQEPCLDFVDSLWTNEGGFHGHWHEEHLDCEYTYYGLLSLGHLSL